MKNNHGERGPDMSPEVIRARLKEVSDLYHLYSKIKNCENKDNG
jgi:hypothetical protein